MRERKLLCIQHILTIKKTFIRTNRYGTTASGHLAVDLIYIGCIQYTEACLVSKQRQTFTFPIHIHKHDYRKTPPCLC